MTVPVAPAGATPPDAAAHRPPRRARWVAVAAISAAVLSFPGLAVWATVTYRSAVGALHDELAGLGPAGARLIGEEVDGCFAGHPASIRSFVADDPVVARASYEAELRSRGFERTSAERWTTRWSRPRADDLDADDVALTIVEDGTTLTVVADVYDIDMVTCTPW